MEMRDLAKLLFSAIGLTVGAAYATPAQAAPEYVLILIDQTGTMCSDAVPCAPAVGSFWLNALDDAKAWVQDDLSSSTNPISTTQRFYAIWTFKDTQDGTQNGAAQLWPTTTFNTGCNDSHASVDPTSGFCKFASNDARPYATLQNVIESIKTMDGQVPQPTWLTPLADSICRSLSTVWASVTGQARTLILESDGGENDSVLACLGPASTAPINTAADVRAARTAGTPDWGFTVGSWQANVLRRGVRLTSFNTPPFDTAEQSAVAAGPLTASESLPPQLTMKVGVQYALCSPGGTDPGCMNGMTAALAAQPSGGFGLRLDGESQAAAATKSAAVGVSATSGKTPSISAGELGFFRAMGGLTPKGKLREVTRDQTVVFGTNHRLAGDVDDSGCVDRADYSIVRQRDVWMQRAVRPLEIAIRADLDRDGWVNEHDRAIVLANWGRGCINPVGPKPSF